MPCGDLIDESASKTSLIQKLTPLSLEPSAPNESPKQSLLKDPQSANIFPIREQKMCQLK